MDQNNGKVFDSKTLIAIVAVGAVFLGWQYYLKTKYPQYYAGKPVVEKTVEETATAAAPDAVAAPSAPTPAAEAAVPEQTFRIDTEEFTAELTNNGMGLRDVLLKKHTDRKKNPMMLVQTKASTFATGIIGKDQLIRFDVKQEGPLRFVGTAVVDGITIIKSMDYNLDQSFWNIHVAVENARAGFPGVKTDIVEPRSLGEPSSFFAPSWDFQEVVLSSEQEIHRIYDGSDLETPGQAFKNAGFASIGNQYFTSAIVDKSPITPEVTMRIPAAAGQDVVVEVRHLIVEPKPKFEFEMRAFSGPKYVEQLEAVDPELSKVVNFGFFNTIGRLLRTVLTWFHGYVGNWGVAIILLTIVVRILVLPFNIISYRSMRAMQAIQPKMQAVREKYKDDPQAMQRETMGLMREHKVNPFGGCLPMLLQMPIFFALFQVLGHSVELYQAPFFWWIQDLSLKDPFFILPILIGGLMYVQQQLTPMNMDPAQARILKWMPLLFVVFMISLPAGLSIYTFVNTLFGVVQQYFFLKDTRKAVSMKEARA